MTNHARVRDADNVVRETQKKENIMRELDLNELKQVAAGSGTNTGVVGSA